MNIKQLNNLLIELRQNPNGNEELIEFYSKKQGELMHKIVLEAMQKTKAYKQDILSIYKSNTEDA
jgi:hypothetical protein|tara:strand:+ start:210 stop:404 length:195 start_codon:yes stop_codon:yes gene_type:complete